MPNGDPRYWLMTEFHEPQSLEKQISEIRANRRTGSLTINFSQGTPLGPFTWKERLKGPHDPSERHLVQTNGSG